MKKLAKIVCKFIKKVCVVIMRLCRTVKVSKLCLHIFTGWTKKVFNDLYRIEHFK